MKSFLRPFLILGFLIGGGCLSPGTASASARDLRVAISGDTITIASRIFIFGEEATDEMAKRIEFSISEVWSRKLNGEFWTYRDERSNRIYTVIFDAQVFLYDGKEKQRPFAAGLTEMGNADNYIHVSFREDGKSNVILGSHGSWNSKSTKLAFAHEFGHLLGLKDRYTKESGKIIPDVGWERNLMANRFGFVEQRNIDAIVKPLFERFSRSKQVESGAPYKAQRVIFLPTQ